MSSFNCYSCNCIVWTLEYQILFKKIKNFFIIRAQ